MKQADDLACDDGALGVFGGSFDPVHFGHLRAALELAFTFDLSKVLLVPNGNPPHRRTAHVETVHRVRMLELAVDKTEQLQVDLREIHREGKSYTFDTLAALRHEMGGERPLIFGLGADAYSNIHTWHRSEELLSVAHLAVLSRPGTELPNTSKLSTSLAHGEVGSVWAEDSSELKIKPYGMMFRLEMTPLAISSTRIRKQISRGWSPRFLLPELVCDYIETNSLYQ